MELFNEEAERALLGALLSNNAVYDRVATLVSADDFYIGLNGRIYSEIQLRLEKGYTVTHTLLKNLSADKDMLSAGGMSYISDLFNDVASIVNASDYARVIRDYAQKRALNDVMQEASESSQTSLPVNQILDNLERSLFNVRGSESVQELGDATEGMISAINWISNIRSGELEPVKTGIRALDKAITGLYPGRMYVLAGRPGMGKTAMALNIADHASQKDKVLYFSMEMTREEMSMRLAARKTGINVQKQLEAISLTPQQIGALRDSVTQKNLVIDERAGISMAQISMTARRFKRQKGLGLILIDYIGLISGDTRLGIVNKVSEITAECKRLAKELGVPVVVLSQLNRGVEKQEDKRPSLADLRDSGSIEQDADVVMMLYREEYYAQRDEGKEQFTGKKAQQRPSLEDVKGKAEVIIAKNRQGQPQTVQIGFNGERQLFHDLGA